MSKEKPIIWIGTSRDDLIAFPIAIKRDAGYQLYRVQNGLEPKNWKPFQQIGKGVKEIRISGGNNIYRIIYVAKFADKIYVLHSFQKKTQKTSSKDIETAKARYKTIKDEEKL